MHRNREYKYLTSPRSRLVAMLLCLFGGYAGLHYFYVRRIWRGAVNLFLMLGLVISSRVFGLSYRMIIRNGAEDYFLHWREIVAVLCAAALGVTWILDLVAIIQRRFRDDQRRVLK